MLAPGGIMWRRKLAIAIVGFVTTSTALEAAPLATPWTVNPDNGHWYALTANYSWVRSEVSARQNGGHLATIRSQAEQDFVFQTFGNWAGTLRLLWIGLNDARSEGQMSWTSGEPVAYTNWYPGEPNSGGNANVDEDFTGIYWPTHIAEGKWNDFYHRNGAFGVQGYGVVEYDPANPVQHAFALATDANWLTIAPLGNQIGQDLNSVGLAFEAAHPDWNTNVSFDTADWSPAVSLGDEYIWGAASTSPVYFRHTFTLDQALHDVEMLMHVDDNALVYINGQLVVNDPLGGASGFLLDITSFLQVGENLIAIKAQDIGVVSSLSVHLFAVPEPGGLILAASAMCSLLALSRGNRSRSSRS
ncbi:MAG: lectin-like protein [Pirellulales bacterium]